jgi:hypothetical protein
MEDVSMRTFRDYKRANPDSYIPEGNSLDHDMEYDEPTGWERCVRCGEWEWPFLEDVCAASPGYVDGHDEWEDYDETVKRAEMEV